MYRNIKKIISVRNYKYGDYKLIKVLASFSKSQSNDLVMTCAFSNFNLEYIGSSKTAWRLAHKFGITEQIQSAKGRTHPIKNKTIADRAKDLLLSKFLDDYSFSPCCAIGFNPIKQKWYGWSHRAIYGFGIGSKVTMGSAAYVSKNKDDFIRETILFWSDERHKNVHFDKDDIVDGEKGFWIKWIVGIVPNKKMINKIDGVFTPYPDSFGRGEWTAETLEDAKQMAKDFANGVG